MINNSKKIVAVITAGGTGKRFGSHIPKQFFELLQEPIIVRTIRNYDDNENISSIIVTVHKEWVDFAKEIIRPFNFKKEIHFVEGGKERTDSINNALNNEIVVKSDAVLIHDAVRPFVSQKLINDVISNVFEFGAVIPALTPKETVKSIHNDFVEKTLDRSSLVNVQTPQGFATESILKAYKQAEENSFVATDDASIAEYSNIPVKIINGEETNIKITTPYDLELAKAIYRILHQIEVKE